MEAKDVVFGIFVCVVSCISSALGQESEYLLYYLPRHCGLFCDDGLKSVVMMMMGSLRNVKRRIRDAPPGYNRVALKSDGTTGQFMPANRPGAAPRF